MRELILHNAGWKLLSLLLASLIWYNIHSDLVDVPTVTHNPVSPFTGDEFKKVAVGVLIPAGESRPLRVTPSRVSLELRGETNRLSGLATREVQVFVSPTAGELAGGGPVELPVRVVLPHGLELVGVTPPRVILDRMPVPSPTAVPGPGPAPAPAPMRR